MACCACVCVCDCSSIAVVSSRPHVENDVAVASVEKWREKMKSFLIIFAAVADWHKQLVLSISTPNRRSHTELIAPSKSVSEWVSERDRECSLTTYFSQTHTTQPKNGKMELIKIFYRIDFIFISLLLLSWRGRQGKTSIVSTLVEILLFEMKFYWEKCSTRIKYKTRNVKEEKKAKSNWNEMSFKYFRLNFSLKFS